MNMSFSESVVDILVGSSNNYKFFDFSFSEELYS